MGWNGMANGAMMAASGMPSAGWAMGPQRMVARDRSGAGAGKSGQQGMMRNGGQSGTSLGPSPPGGRLTGKPGVANGMGTRVPGRTISPGERQAGNTAQQLVKRGSSDSEQHTHIPPGQAAMQMMQQVGRVTGRMGPAMIMPAMQNSDAVQDSVFDYPASDAPSGLGDGMLQMGRMFGSGGGARMMASFTPGYMPDGAMDPQTMYAGAYPAGAYMMPNPKQVRCVGCPCSP